MSIDRMAFLGCSDETETFGSVIKRLKMMPIRLDQDGKIAEHELARINAILAPHDVKCGAFDKYSGSIIFEPL